MNAWATCGDYWYVQITQQTRDVLLFKLIRATSEYSATFFTYLGTLAIL